MRPPLASYRAGRESLVAWAAASGRFTGRELSWLVGYLPGLRAEPRADRRHLGESSAQTWPRSALLHLCATAGLLAVAVAWLAYAALAGATVNRAAWTAAWGLIGGLAALRLISAAISVRRSLAEQRRLHQEMGFRATHDPLTGLANRDLFARALDAAIESAPDTTMVLFLDLDDFKAVNDTLGHAVGDEVITIVATRLAAAIRPCDLVARLGGDEFAILFHDIEPGGEAAITERALGAFADHISVAGRALTITASAGMAFAGRELDRAEVLRRADIAMYVAKAADGNSCELFELARHTEAVNRLALRSDLSQALAEHQMLIHYQPIYRLLDGELCGVEALVRWQHPTRGLLPMAEFRSLIEDTVLMLPLGRFVLESACAQIASWRAAGLTGLLPVRVNLSARELESPTLLETVAAALAGHGASAADLIFEVAETSLAQAHSRRPILEGLAGRGFGLSLDNFGLGRMSLALICDLPFSEVKVSPACMSGLDSTRRRALLPDIVRIAANLGLVPTAQGIEDPDQGEYLRSCGFVRGQGMAFVAPMAAAELEKLLGHLQPQAESDSLGAGQTPATATTEFEHTLGRPG